MTGSPRRSCGRGNAGGAGPERFPEEPATAANDNPERPEADAAAVRDKPEAEGTDPPDRPRGEDVERVEAWLSARTRLPPKFRREPENQLLPRDIAAWRGAVRE